MNKVQTITILFNLPGLGEGGVWAKEADADTWQSAVEVKKVLDDMGYRSQLLGIGPAEAWKIKSIKSDLIFNLIEWTGADAKYAVMAFREIEKLGVPYTGSDIKGYLLSVDKLKMKKMMKQLGILTPRWQVFKAGQKVKKSLEYPVILKPAYEHCGIGISQDSVIGSDRLLQSKVMEMAEQFKQPILAEEYIEGMEVNVTILERNGKPWVLPPVEVVFGGVGDGRPIFTYERKWNDKALEFWQTTVRIAQLSPSMTAQIREDAKRAYTGLGGRDYPRLDLRISGNLAYVLEINNNPEIDFTFQGGIRESAAAIGLNHGKLLAHVVENAYERFSRQKYASI